MSRQSSGRDPFLDRAEEEGEGTELLEPPHHGAFLEQEREEAHGVEVFEDPDATLPASALKESSPGHEILTGDAVGLGREDDEDRENQSEESWSASGAQTCQMALPHKRVDFDNRKDRAWLVRTTSRLERGQGPR